MERRGPERNGGGRWHSESVDDAVVRMNPSAASELIEAYRSASHALDESGHNIGHVLYQAAVLLDQPHVSAPFGVLAVDLGRDGDDLDWRLDFLLATDGFAPEVTRLRRLAPVDDWMLQSANVMTFEQMAVLIAHADSEAELDRLMTWMLSTGAFLKHHPRGKDPVIPEEYRQLFAGAFSSVFERGAHQDAGGLPVWLLGGIMAYGNPSEETILLLAGQAFDSDRALEDAAALNPFDLDRETGAFTPFADHFVKNPIAGRAFVDSLLADHDARRGRSPLVLPEDNTTRMAQLALLLGHAGRAGSLQSQARFVDRLVDVLNTSTRTNGLVFWTTWRLHAELVLDHDVTTSTPTFGLHHPFDDNKRAAWEAVWNSSISPAALDAGFHAARAATIAGGIVLDVAGSGTVRPEDALAKRLGELFVDAPHGGSRNDAGGTYTTRAKANFAGSPASVSAEERGRKVVRHALWDSSDTGDIARDEFAIIDHGIGANNKPTYTINLPGVIDLSNPMPGWDPVHASVRDMDMAALKSATSAELEDNLYAQMVEEALWRNEIPLGSNLMLVGHSFGADTAADLAAHDGFTERYNVTHVVAAAYDSVPQLAHISPEIDVLVLQNEDDKAILLEATQRKAAMSRESVSVNTFAHEVRRFDGGMGGDVGHHQKRYNSYLDHTTDAELTRFFESVTATGYGTPGTSVAIDVTIDESLLQ